MSTLSPCPWPRFCQPTFPSFCGSTDDFCATGCQEEYGGCGEPKRPTCATSGGNKRVVGYYESWASTRACQQVNPEDLHVAGYTHINFAFAFFDPMDYVIAPMGGRSEDLFARFTALKNSNPGLQTWISIAGWSFTDPGPTHTAFSGMVSSPGRRQKFIVEVKHFMTYYGFEGVDLDWEYPQADDRGGAPDDKDTYAMLVQEMRGAFSIGLCQYQREHSVPKTTIPFLECLLAGFSAEGIRPTIRQIDFPHLLGKSDQRWDNNGV